MIDHRQCFNCKHAYYSSQGRHAKIKFTWCNCLDHTGQQHKVIDGVCLSNTALTDENKKAEALKKAREMGKNAYISRKDD